jgi:hypothetical protein
LRKFLPAVTVLFLCCLLAPPASAEPAHPHPFTVEPTPQYDVPKCNPKTQVIVEVHGVQLALPRLDNIALLLDDGTQLIGLDRQGPDYKCQGLLKGVRGVETEAFSIGEPITDQNAVKAQDQLHDTFLQMRANPGMFRTAGKVTKLPSGIETVSFAGYEAFFLPTAEAPTMDGGPVVFVCQGMTGRAFLDSIPHVCNVSYYLPTKLRFSYKFIRGDHPPDSFIALDQSRRKLLNGMITEAKNTPEVTPGEAPGNVKDGK